MNSACRIGVVPASGGETTWMKLEGDPRNNYVARMDWAASSDEVAGQTGLYYDKCQPKEVSAAAQDATLQRELWALSEELTGTRG